VKKAAMVRTRLITETVVLTVLLLSVALAGPAAAETISAERIAKTTRLLPLKKVTVGPDDQYQGVIDSAEKTIVYTRKSDLVPHLWQQHLETGEAVPVLELSADSQQPALSPDGKLAFVYFRHNSRGDVCYRPLGGWGSLQEPTCVPADDGERASPFWRSETELGYTVRKVGSLETKVVLFELPTGTKRVVAEGKVWSPAMNPGGRYLFLNLATEEKATPKGAPAGGRKLLVVDLETGKKRELSFPLPGVSAFPAVDDSGRWLYFSHFLNDTNDDGVIDGDDNGVVFRVPIDPVTGDTATLPEQLTSAESNCSYPKPTKNALYVTCAFEGSLDIYRLPVSGIVPSDWSAETLWSAHRTARSYHERILLLNTLAFRYASAAPENLALRLFSNHLLAGDVAAARYYLPALEGGEGPSRVALARLLLEGRERWRRMRSLEPPREVVGQLIALDTAASKAKGPESLRLLVRGHLNAYANRTAEAASFLAAASASNTAGPLERHLWVELAGIVLPRTGKIGNLDDIYRAVVSAPELTEEARIAHAFRFIGQLEALEPTFSRRLARLESAEKVAPEPIRTLYSAELAALRLVGAKESDEKDKAYRALDKLMLASRANYFLRKALYVRTILVFTAGAEFKYLSYVATNWLRFTKADDTEYAHAREVVVTASMDRAYDAVGKGQAEFAGNFFFGSLSLTDDLESHAGYVRVMLSRNARATLNERYRNLREQNFVRDNQKFVDALLLVLLDGSGRTVEASAVDRAIAKLEAMTQDRDTAVRHLFLGWCYLEKLRRTAQGYQFDAGLLRDAHRSLMLALDLGRDNDRVRAAALSNLAALHQRVQNHGLAARFFEQRKPLGFADATERAFFAAAYAKSLFYGYRIEEAIGELEEALAKGNDAKLSTLVRTVLEERLAFLLAVAGRGKAALERYEKLFAANAFTDPRNEAKASVAAGYAAFRAGDLPRARERLRRADLLASSLPRVPAGGDRLVEFRPERLRLVATGLLARIETGTARREALATRGDLLRRFSELSQNTGTLLVQNRLQLADAWLAEGEAGAATAHGLLREALVEAAKLGESGQWLGQPVYRALTAYLSRGIVDRARFAADDATLPRRMVDNAVKAMAAQPAPQPVLDYQRSKLKMLWAAYESRVLSGRTPEKRKLEGMIVPGASNAPELKRLASVLAN
jgi:hypothetical protein